MLKYIYMYLGINMSYVQNSVLAQFSENKNDDKLKMESEICIYLTLI